VFPQAPWSSPAWQQPETIRVSAREIKDGPTDDRFVTKDARDKLPYSEFTQPPYEGPTATLAKARNGNWDHYKIEDREFKSCAMYATVRFVLDIWEGYRGKPIEWVFRQHFEKLELIPQIEWGNAQSGYGFLEFGYGSIDNQIDHEKPHCLNFDVLAHELGHNFIFSLVGFPTSEAKLTADFGGFHESCGDLVAIVSSLHFETMVTRLLTRTSGNLFSRNELARLGELSEVEQIRIAFNDDTMGTVGTEPHDRSTPLTGAIFDIFVEMYQYLLVNAELITEDLANRSFNNNVLQLPSDIEKIQKEFDVAFKKNSKGFTKALISARDYLGKLLILAWDGLKANNLSYGKVALALLSADLKLTRGAFQKTIRSCFKWRKIVIPFSISPMYMRHRIDTCNGTMPSTIPTLVNTQKVKIAES
jgi:hypothetical protein